MRINSLRKKAAMLLPLALLLAISAFAQTSASLSGTVHDPQGGAVAGAKVTLKDASGGAHLESSTSNEGFYTFPIIQPGTYTVTIEAPGFKKFVKSKQATLGHAAVLTGAVATPAPVATGRSRWNPVATAPVSTAAFEVCHWSLQEIGSVNSQ